MEVVVWFIQNNWGNILWKSGLHFVSSGFVGLLVYWLTSTMLSRYYSGGTLPLRFPKVEFGIHHFSLSLAFLFAIWFHILEDYTLNLF